MMLGACLGLLLTALACQWLMPRRGAGLPGWWRRWAPARCWSLACRPARWREPGQCSAATLSALVGIATACAGSARRNWRPRAGVAVAIGLMLACRCCIRPAAPRRC